MQQAESKYLGELVKLGITKQQAEEFVKKYGISEELLIGQVADDAIAKVPAVVQKQVAREKAQQYLSRQRALTQRGAGTPQELDDAETDWRTAAANYDDAVQSARTVIANAIAAKVGLSQAEQTLHDMTIRAPTPKLIPPSLNRTSVLSYGITKRQVSEGQMIKEGEAVAELVIEDPIRLWSQVPEQYADDVQRRPARPALDPGPSRRCHSRARSRGSTRRSTRPAGRSRSRPWCPTSAVCSGPADSPRPRSSPTPRPRRPSCRLESIVRFAGVTKLFIVENGKARSINDIKTGNEGRGWVEVTSKLLPDDRQVVTTGQTQLADGTPVVIREPEPAAEPKRGRNRAQVPRPPRRRRRPLATLARSVDSQVARPRPQDLLPFLVTIQAFP